MAGEQDFLNAIAVRLDGVIEAAEAGLEYVDVVEHFHDHAPCETGQE